MTSKNVDMLMVAVTNNDLLMLKKLLTENFSTQDLADALIVAATQPHASKIMDMLLKAGALLDHRALRAAVLAAEPENVLFLIQRGSPVTPELLVDAVETRRGNIVKVLLNNDIDPNIRIDGKLAIETAALDNQWHLVKILMKVTDERLIKKDIAKKIRKYYSVHKAQMDIGSMKNLASIIETYGADFSETISNTVAENIIKGYSQEDSLDLHKLLRQASQEGAKAAFKMIEQISSQSDPLSIAKAFAAHPQAQQLKKFVSTETAAKFLKTAGINIPMLRPTQQRGQMPAMETFDDQVQAAFEDLQKYPDKHIKLLAKQMKVQNCENKSHDLLCRELARKIIYIHSDKIPSADRSRCERYTKKFSSSKINNIRAQIYKEFRRYKDSVYKMNSEELQKLLQRYDEICFDGDIEKYMTDAKYSLKFKTSGEETFTTEGICTHKACDYTITIPTAYFKNVKNITIVAGHSCKDQLECLLRVIEHELVHLIIFIFCGDTFITDQHGPLFMNTVGDLFGHTDYRHYIF